MSHNSEQAAPTKPFEIQDVNTVPVVSQSNAQPSMNNVEQKNNAAPVQINDNPTPMSNPYSRNPVVNSVAPIVNNFAPAINSVAPVYQPKESFTTKPAQFPYTPSSGPYNPSPAPYNPSSAPHNPSPAPYIPSSMPYNPSSTPFNPYNQTMNSHQTTPQNSVPNDPSFSGPSPVPNHVQASINNPVSSNYTPGSPYYHAPNVNVNQPAPAHLNNVSSYQHMTPANAWNDPPMLVRTRKMSEKSTDYNAPVPINQPIIGGPQPIEQVPPGAPTQNTPLFNSQVYQPQVPQNNGVEQRSRTPSIPLNEPAKVVSKEPIPEEYKFVQDILDKLLKQCLSSTNNSQMQKKLNDVAIKLEALYDKLRDRSLSPNTINGIYTLIQAIQSFDYQLGLNYYGQIVSQCNFIEIKSFMPGIKILMQSAAQLQVYIQ